MKRIRRRISAETELLRCHEGAHLEEFLQINDTDARGLNRGYNGRASDTGGLSYLLRQCE